MVLLGDEAQVDARFGSFGDRANLDARYTVSIKRTTNSEIILHTPDRTPW
jgi:hypothetical protein